jgi:hypothetical protein
MHTSHFIGTILVMTGMGMANLGAQGTASFKNFNLYKEVVPGVDFFAASRQETTSFQKPVAEARGRIATLLGSDLPRGAIFICSSLAQKDSVYEPKALRMGYGWILSALTAEARADETLARIKSQMGGEVPAEVIQRIRNRPPEMKAAAEAQMVNTAIRQMAYAILQSALASDLDYRSSRLDDMGRSPLPDWLDIGIASYATGGGANLGYLQQHLEEGFPIEDVISMSRPFVAPSTDEGGGGMVIRMGGGGAPPGGGQPGTGGGGGQRGGTPRVLPKDQQDRLLFDGQASTFFMYLVEKVGIEKVKELVRSGIEGKESREFIQRPDILGPDFEKIETDWKEWVKSQKPEQTQEFRIRTGPGAPAKPPDFRENGNYGH